MNQNQLLKKYAYIVMEYYRNNVQPLPDSFGEDCIWIGPAQGQIIRSRQAILEAVDQAQSEIAYDLRNLQIILDPVNEGCLDVVTTYTVLACYPDGENLSYKHRTEFLWVEEPVGDGQPGTTFRVRSCHDSNEFPYDARDTIYPNHFTELSIARLLRVVEQSGSVVPKGLAGSNLYLSEDSVLWLESKRSHTLIHTLAQVYEAAEHIDTVVEKFASSLCKTHISYAVNPMHVSKIGRFYVQLKDGTRLPMQEKRYTKTNAKINKRLETLRKD